MLAELIIEALGDMPEKSLSMSAKSEELAEKVLSRRAETKDVDERIAQLEDDVARLALFVRTLIKVCIDKRVFASSEFESTFDAIDIVDGSADGRITPQAAPESCPKCGKRLSRRKRPCFYCGYVVPPSKTMEDWGRK